MVHFIIQGPQWFFGLDSVVEIIAGIIALLIVLASVRYSRLAKEKSYAALGGGFFLIFLSFISQVTTSLFIYRQFNAVRGTIVDITNTLFVGHVAYVLFFIAGLMVLTIWALRIKENMQRALLVSLMLLLAVIGTTNSLVYNLTALLLLVFICAKFFLNATAQGTPCAWEVLMGFVFITLARLAFILEPLDPVWYVGGHLSQLLGYLILLLVLIQVLRK